MIVSSSTMKPQNVAACAAPGTDHFSSLRCPTTSAAWTSASRPGCARTEATRSGAGCPVRASRFSHHNRRPATANAIAVRARPTVIRKTTPYLLFPELKRSGAESSKFMSPHGNVIGLD